MRKKNPDMTKKENFVVSLSIKNILEYRIAQRCGKFFDCFEIIFLVISQYMIKTKFRNYLISHHQRGQIFILIC